MALFSRLNPFNLIGRFSRFVSGDPGLEKTQDNLKYFEDELAKLFLICGPVAHGTSGETTIMHSLGRAPVLVVPAYPREEITSYKVIKNGTKSTTVEVTASSAGFCDWLVM
jgi:hypothetical protein